MPSRIVIDARKLGDGGIGVYIENLVDGLIESRVFEKIQLIVTPQESTAQECHALKRWAGKVDLIFDSTKKYSFSEYFFMAFRLKSVFKNSLIHFPHYTVPFFLPKSARVVVTIHDCIHLRSRNVIKRLLAKFMLGHALRRADRVITVSNYSKDTILKNFYFVDAKKIDVIANNISPDIKLNKTNSSSDYYLFVGSGREHKGLELALNACKTEKLIVVGSSFSAQQKENIEQTAILVGACSGAELAKLYSGAKALIMPSYEEGFGIPVLEALSLGVPVVATPVASLIEWFGDTIWYANQFDADSLKKAIELMLANPELRQRKIKEGLELAGKFTVTSSAIKTLESYQKVAPALKLDSRPAESLSKVA